MLDSCGRCRLPAYFWVLILSRRWWPLSAPCCPHWGLGCFPCPPGTETRDLWGWACGPLAGSMRPHTIQHPLGWSFNVSRVIGSYNPYFLTTPKGAWRSEVTIQIFLVFRIFQILHIQSANPCSSDSHAVKGTGVGHGVSCCK